jgi:Spy/CpxP family protein refolding chaperone
MKSMKSMMVAALVVGSLFACSTATFAQAGGGAGGAGGAGRRGAMTSDAMIARFQKALGDANKLTDAEIPQIKTVIDKMIKDQSDLRADTTTAAADKRTKRTAITTEASDAIKAIVTPAQFTIIQPLLQRGGGRGGAGGGTPPATPPAGN